MSGASKNRFWGPHPIDKLDCIVSGFIMPWIAIEVWAVVGIVWGSFTGSWGILYPLGNLWVWAVVFIIGVSSFSIFFMWADSHGVVNDRP